ncbi:MAG TPA: FimV/HubP family polar landmark protein [Dokdonella sp.]
MKRSLQRPLAIALALGGAQAWALGLGPVHVNSRLNQPLDAEIPVIEGGAGEAEGLVASLADAEDFERVGLSRARLTVPLDFAVVKRAKGDVVIKVTSKEPIRQAFLDFLLEANWPKGRVLREYTVLLDPPVTAPATRTAAVPAPSPAPASPGSVTLVHRERPPGAPAPARTPAAAAPPATPATPRKVVSGQYGPVAAGETLLQIARAERPDERTNLNQMMLALLRSNPNAFYKDNVNALKRGAILRIPSAEEIRAVASASDAAAQVREQVDDWRGVHAASPTLVADGGGASASPAAASPRGAAPPASGGAAASGERLELVPPKAGKDSVAMADRPGAGAGSSGSGGTELRAELARTKEALTAREQEAGELKSRVQALEDLKGKNDRLISLKDAEIAELQQKLAQLQAQPAAAAAKPAGAAPAATDTISKQDVWGNAGNGSAAPSAATATPPSDASAASVTAAPSAPPAASSATSSTPPSSSTPSAPAAGAAGTPPPAAAEAAATAAATAAAAPPAPAPTAASPKPAAAKAPPLRRATPAWYEQPWFLPAALAIAAVILLLGLIGLRRRNAAPTAATRGSIADVFGDAPLDASATALGSGSEEAQLREQIEREPDNVGLHLELLSLYYAERDVDKFEDAARAMHAHVVDPEQPEWLEAQAMGRELAPHDPLFASVPHHGEVRAAAAAAAAHEAAFGVPRFDDEPPSAHAEPVPSAHASDAPVAEHEFGFDLDDVPPAPAASSSPAAAAAHADDGFDFDLPPLDFDVSPPAAAPAAAAPAAERDVDDAPASAPAARLDDDYFAGEDAVGTKLDLAKAYMDMGDPEGARSMLEEVVAEGSEVQKAEAHRLMAEIR